MDGIRVRHLAFQAQLNGYVAAHGPVVVGDKTFTFWPGEEEKIPVGQGPWGVARVERPATSR